MVYLTLQKPHASSSAWRTGSKRWSKSTNVTLKKSLSKVKTQIKNCEDSLTGHEIDVHDDCELQASRRVLVLGGRLVSRTTQPGTTRWIPFHTLVHPAYEPGRRTDSHAQKDHGLQHDENEPREKLVLLFVLGAWNKITFFSNQEDDHGRSFGLTNRARGGGGRRC